VPGNYADPGDDSELGSDDDESDEEPDTSNLVLCQYDKVSPKGIYCGWSRCTNSTLRQLIELLRSAGSAHEDKVEGAAEGWHDAGAWTGLCFQEG
jgi:hypothetical protein